MSHSDLVVIGSGASGIHFARRALEFGRQVHMLDVGIRKPEPVLPESNFHELKRDLPNAHDYFLGPQNEALILPENDDEYYGFPPSKEFVFENPRPQASSNEGFHPLYSYARGGLAEAWTGGSYPFSADEIRDYPFAFADLLKHYENVAGNIGISGVEDDLASIMPFHSNIEAPVPLDEHGTALEKIYESKKRRLAAESFVMGRARLALISKDRGDRSGCKQLNRCLWGCPIGAIYTPSWTLIDLLQHENFTYTSGVKVSHFQLNGAQVKGVVATDLKDGARQEISCNRLVMAAGTLESARIFLKSIARDGEESPELTGLMDNRQVLMPFVNFRMLGKKWDVKNYQYHQLAMGLVHEDPFDYVHGLVTTLKSAMLHPVVQSLPFSLGTSAKFFREMHTALGLLNINFSDQRRPGNRIAYEEQGDSERLLIRYEPATNEDARIRLVLKRFRRILRTLGCLAPGGMTHMRPMGASVHYAGTLPMRSSAERWTLSPSGRSHDFENLWFVDGSGLPSLPAKNLTFTLMANASRIAEADFS